MTALFNFKARFVEPITSRRKRQTIRAERKRPVLKGETLRLQHGSRMRPVLIGFATALEVQGIRIHPEEGWAERTMYQGAVQRVNDMDLFATLDGFRDWADMRAFWLAEHKARREKLLGDPWPFDGFLTFWGSTLRADRDPAAGRIAPSGTTPAT